MSTEYLKITLTGMELDEGSPSPPNIIYLEYPVPDDGVANNAIGTVDASTFVLYDWSNLAPVRLRYVSYEFLGGYWEYAELHSNLNSDFLAAIESGNLSGIYTGQHGEIWNIDHIVHIDDDMDLPSGEGGEEGTVFTFSTPLVQTGGEPPNRAQNPTPEDDVSGLNLMVPYLVWEAG